MSTVLSTTAIDKIIIIKHSNSRLTSTSFSQNELSPIGTAFLMKMGRVQLEQPTSNYLLHQLEWYLIRITFSTHNINLPKSSKTPTDGYARQVWVLPGCLPPGSIQRLRDVIRRGKIHCDSIWSPVDTQKKTFR